MQQIRVAKKQLHKLPVRHLHFPFTSQQTWHNNNIDGKKKAIDRDETTKITQNKTMWSRQQQY